MTDGSNYLSVDELVARIPDGALLAIPCNESGVAMAATRALIRRGVKDLRLVAVPVSGIQADLLIGAGCVAEIETSAVSLSEYGPAPRFTEAVKTATVTIHEATCPAIHSGLQAAEKGIPFMPLRGIIGSDILAHRPDWKTIDNPLASPGESGGDPIVVLPAIRPDVALFHVPMGDRAGNVWVGRERDLTTMAHASKETLVTVEQLYDGDFYDDPRLGAGALSSLYVSAVAVAPKGAWPMGLADRYGDDADHLRLYAEQARTKDGFARYLETFVFGESGT
ncbi:MAG: CoA synthetase [Proteobacteria bacterium]|nr:CoA synthetase [Pseudomonadota bacterium]